MGRRSGKLGDVDFYYYLYMGAIRVEKVRLHE